MSETPASTPVRRTAATVGAAVVVAAVVTVVTPRVFVSTVSMRPRMGLGPGVVNGHPLEQLVTVKLFVSTYTVVLLAVLAGTYARLYRELPNRFTLSLLAFTAALLLYALTSSPLVSLTLGYRGSGLGPFTFLPDLFAAVAVTFLFYESSV